MKSIIKYGSAFYLGFALTFFADISFLQWEFYAIAIPVFIFAEIRSYFGE